jgi:hypothetical protein
MQFATGFSPFESIAFRIECLGSGRLHASFFGEGRYIPAFYNILAGIKKSD